MCFYRLHLSLILNKTKFKHPVGIQPVGQKIVCFLNHCYIDAIAVLVLIIVPFFFLWRCPQDLSMLKTAEKNFKEKHIVFQTSEDCLYLSVYSPAGSSKKDKLPVCKPLNKLVFYKACK